MNLLLADLRALTNLVATRVGGRTSFGVVVGLLLLALMSWMLAGATLASPQLRQMLLQQSGGRDPIEGLLGHALLTCPIVATWLGLAQARRQLFEAPELLLWRQAPMATVRGSLQIFARAVFVSLLWCCALTAPLLIAVLQHADAQPLAYALLPLALVACTTPLLATLLGLQIVMVRLLPGSWFRVVMVATAAIASVAFTIWMLLNLFTSSGERAEQIALVVHDGRELPLTVAAAAAALARAATGELDQAPLTTLLLWIGAACTGFGLCSLLHDRAHERYQEAARPMWRRIRRRWPTSLVATVRKKEFAQVLQQPGVLVGFVVFAALVYGLASRHLLVDNILSMTRLPRELRELAALLTWWFLAVLLVLYAHMGRLALWDGPQWPLYMASPADGRHILRGKLQAIAVFLLWPMLLVAAAGMQLLAVRGPTLLWFVGFAVAGTLAALGIIAAVGTEPRLMRPDSDGQILQGGKSFLAAMIMVTAFQVTMMPVVIGWQWLVRAVHREHVPMRTLLEYAPYALGAALCYGILIALAGSWLGGLHYRRLLAPR